MRLCESYIWYVFLVLDLVENIRGWPAQTFLLFQKSSISPFTGLIITLIGWWMLKLFPKMQFNNKCIIYVLLWETHVSRNNYTICKLQEWLYYLLCYDTPLKMNNIQRNNIQMQWIKHWLYIKWWILLHLYFPIF